MLLCSGASAQSALSSLSGKNTSEVVEPDQVRQRSITSFESRAKRRVERALERLGDDSARQRLEELVSQRVADYREHIASEIDQLGVDGALTVEEAESHLGPISERAWNALSEAVRAIEEGKEPPPFREDDEGRWHYVWRVLEYVFVTRNGWGTWAIVGGSLAGGVLIAWLCSLGLSKLRDHEQIKHRAAVGKLVLALRAPVYAMCIVGGLTYGLAHVWMPPEAEEFASFLAKLSIAVVGVWLAWGIVSLAAEGSGWILRRTYHNPDKQATAIIRKALQLLVLAAAVLIVTELMFGVAIRNVLVGVGLIGLVVSLAAQDTLKNLFGSFAIVMDRPFRVGDLVQFKDYFGWVEDIGFRSTRIREFDGHLVTVPNSEITDGAVENVEARPWIRRRFRLSLRYDTPAEKVEQAIEILRDILCERDDEPSKMPTHVVFESFADYSLNLLVQYCVTPGEYWPALKRGSELHLEILRRFNAEGIEFAYPTRTMVMETDSKHEAQLDLQRQRGGGEASSQDAERDGQAMRRRD